MSSFQSHDLAQTRSLRRRNRSTTQPLWIGPELNELGQPKSRGMQPEYLPTPAEIAAICLQIQSEWTPEERRRRAGGLLPAEIEVGTAVA